MPRQWHAQRAVRESHEDLLRGAADDGSGDHDPDGTAILRFIDGVELVVVAFDEACEVFQENSCLRCLRFYCRFFICLLRCLCPPFLLM